MRVAKHQKYVITPKEKMLLLLLLCNMSTLSWLLLFPKSANAFMIQPVPGATRMVSSRHHRHTPLQVTLRQEPRKWQTLSSRLFSITLPEIETMKIGEIRKELESYGISTKSFLEKKEMIEALQKARAEGKQPINNNAQSSTSSAGANDATQQQPRQAHGASESSTATGSSTKTRAERIQEEMSKAQKMQIGELKKELTDRGISTKSFFEKSEFVKAYAEAVVDGVNKKSSTQHRQQEEEHFDPSYRDVIMTKMDRQAKNLLTGTVIDITLGR